MSTQQGQMETLLRDVPVKIVLNDSGILAAGRVSREHRGIFL